MSTVFGRDLNGASKLLDMDGAFETFKTPEDERIKVIVDAVCDYYQINRAALLIRERREAICYRRFVAFWLLRKVGLLSWHQIGDAMGYDHGTVIHGCRSLKNRIESQPEGKLAADVAALASVVSTALNLGSNAPIQQ